MGCEEMALDQELAQAIDDEESYEKILEIATKNWPDQYMGGLEDCVVEWADVGTAFSISEYDGYESVEYSETKYWSVAR